MFSVFTKRYFVVFTPVQVSDKLVYYENVREWHVI